MGAAVALAVALVLAGSGPPSVQDVAAAALRSPTQPAPATDPTDRRFVRAEVGGVRFPDYQRPWGWHAIGARTDEIDGRHALTVVYGKDGLGVHYTVVDGAPLRLPNAVRRAKKDGPRIAAMRDGGTSVIAWHQGGHTCVLASRDLDTKALMHFAAWR